MIARVRRTPRTLLCLLSTLAIAGLWMTPSGALAVSSHTASSGGESGKSSGAARGGSAGSSSTSAGSGGSASSSGGLEGAGTSGLTSTGNERTTESNGPLGFSAIIVGLGGAAALIAAIAAFIIRDARKNAPVPEGFLDGADAVSPEQARKRRAKAKAARQQRKRNRRRR